MGIGPIVGLGGANSARILLEVDSKNNDPKLVLQTDNEPGKLTDPPIINLQEKSIDAPYERRQLYGRGYLFSLSNLDEKVCYKFGFMNGTGKAVLPGSTGRFRTVPAVMTEPVSFILTSCNNYDAYNDIAMYAHIWDDLAELIENDPSIRMIIHSGDQVYCDKVWDTATENYFNDTRGMARKQKREWCERHAGIWTQKYRGVYREAWEHPSAHRVLSSIPNVMMWDDHDVHDGYGSHPTDFWPAQRYLAKIACNVFDQLQASLNPIPNMGSDNRAFYEKLLGCHFIVLDTRSCRNSKKKKLLGAQQWRRLRQIIASIEPNSGPVFLVSSTPVMNFALRGGFLSKIIKIVGSAVGNLKDDLIDAWDSDANCHEMKDLLEELQNALARGVGPITVLSGDIHVHHIAKWWHEETPELLVNQVTASPLTNCPLGNWGFDITYKKEHIGVPLELLGDYYGLASWIRNKRGYAQIALDPNMPTGKRIKVRFRFEERLGEPLQSTNWRDLT